MRSYLKVTILQECVSVQFMLISFQPKKPCFLKLYQKSVDRGKLTLIILFRAKQSRHSVILPTA